MPWRRDLDEVGPLVDAWAKAKVDPDAAVTDVSSPGNGMSSETVLFEMTVAGDHEKYAARLAPHPMSSRCFPNTTSNCRRNACSSSGRAPTCPRPRCAGSSSTRSGWERRSSSCGALRAMRHPISRRTSSWAGSRRRRRNSAPRCSVARSKCSQRSTRSIRTTRTCRSWHDRSMARRRWDNSSATNAGTTTGHAKGSRIP